MSMTEYSCPVQTKRMVLVTDIHYCDKAWYGTTKEQRGEALCRALKQRMAEKPFDGILCLGDYSLDFWAWNEGGSYLNSPPVSNTKKFVEQVVPDFPCRPFLIAGNHEQYGNEKWREITGFPRQFAVCWGDTVFLMLDTFAGNLDPTAHSDGTYTGIDAAILKEALERYREKNIVLCMHELIPEQETEEVREIIASHPRILCAFAGHIHRSRTTLLDDSWGRLMLVHCGDFSYSNSPVPSWGWQELELAQDLVTFYYQVGK